MLRAGMALAGARRWPCASSALSAAASGSSEITTGVENSGTISDGHAPVYTRTAADASSGQRGRGLKSSAVGPAQPQPLDAGPGDHGAVVGAELYRRRDQARAVPAATSRAGCADRGWPRRRRPRPASAIGASAQRVGAAVGQDVADGALEARRRDRRRAARSSWVELLDGLAHRRLEAGEGEVAARLAPHRPRQGEALRDRRPCAACSTAGPPGKPRPRSLAVLSKHSPTASSMVVPSRVKSPGPRTVRSWQWPPETSSSR